MSVEVIGNELATFVGQPQYGLKVSKLVRGLTNKSMTGDSPLPQKLTCNASARYS